MNVRVKCTKPRCSNPIFWTGLDSFHNKIAECLDCGRSDFVYMADEDGNLIHPTECCPTCNKPALLIERCRCAHYCIKCVHGHEWHTCKVHKKRVIGNAHNPDVPPGDCSCVEDR